MTDQQSDIPAINPREAALTMYYTLEELAVIANYFGLDTLPGVREVELSEATRSLATRTLLARNILNVQGEKVSINSPHAQFFVTMADNPGVTQVDMTTTNGPWRTTLFALEDGSVLVEEPDQGVVVVALYQGTCDDVVKDLMGLAAPNGAAQRPDLSAVDVTVFHRSGESVEVTHVRYEPADGAWAQVNAPG